MSHADEEYRKTYLGDGLYANYEGGQFVLTAEDGVRILNRVYLEPPVYRAFVKYADAMLAQRKRQT